MPRTRSGLRRRRTPLLLLLLLLAVAGLFAWAGALALGAADDVRQAQARLQQARASEAGIEGVERSLGDAQRLLARAERRLDAVPVRLVAAVPLVGRSFAAERAVVRAGDDVVDGLAAVVREAPALAAGDGVDVAVIGRLADQLDVVSRRASASYEQLRLTPTGLTPPPVAKAVRDAEAALGPVVEGLREGAVGARLGAGLLGADGERRVVFALQNNAELRGTGGYVSTVADGVAEDGRLRIEPFREIIEFADLPSRARPVIAPADYIEDYGRYLAHTTHFRNWTMSPDVPVAAAVGSRALGELTGQAPDVMVLLDVAAMSEIVRLGGGDVVLDDGTRLSAEDLGDALLVDEYARAGSDREQQNLRRQRLARAATGAVTRLLDGSIAPLDTVRALGRLASGRHLAVWSDRPDEQRSLEALGLSGSIDPGDDDLVHVSVNNLNSNKLDYYVDRSVSVDAQVGPSSARVTQRVRLTNSAPADLVSYVAGEETPGVVSERIELSFARGATLDGFTVDGEPARAFLREHPTRSAVVTYVTLERGQSVELELAYTTPAPFGSYRVHLVPQPLARDASLDLRVGTQSGAALTRVAGAAVDGRGRVVESGAWEQQRLVQATAPTGSGD